MKYLCILILALILTGCGDSLSAQEGGLNLNPAYKAHLENMYQVVQECTELKGEPFESIHIEIFPETFPCQYQSGLCNGEYTKPNVIFMSNSVIFPHELIHYLLYLNTGDLDTAHTSPLWEKCQWKSPSR